MNNTTTVTPRELRERILRQKQRIQRIPVAHKISDRRETGLLRQLESKLAEWDGQHCPHDIVDHRSCADCKQIDVPASWVWRGYLTARYRGDCAGCDDPVRPGQELSKYSHLGEVAYVHRGRCRP